MSVMCNKHTGGSAPKKRRFFFYFAVGLKLKIGAVDPFALTGMVDIKRCR